MKDLDANRIKERSRLTKDEWREYTKTVWHIANVRHPAHPAVFPEEIPRRLIKLFTFYGETVLDPFAGIGTTARAALALGRSAICIEQSRKYARCIKSLLRSDSGKRTRNHRQELKILIGDSRKRMLPPNSVDLIVTSPPYWNKANYGSSSKNVGNTWRYVEFLDEIAPAFRECYRVLRAGRKLCLVTANVNQFTDQGLLTFPLAADFAGRLRDLGFVMVNEIIWSKDGTGGRWGSANHQRPIFGSYPYPPNFLFKNVHEHILVFAKPTEKPNKNPRAQLYSELMKARWPWNGKKL